MAKRRNSPLLRSHFGMAPAPVGAPPRRPRPLPGARPQVPHWPAAILLTVLLSACLPPQASYDFGLGTSRVSGVLTVSDDASAPGGALIVVYKYHHQFVTQGDGSAVLRPSAHVVRPGREGAYSVSVPADVVRLEMLFIAPGHLTEVFRFQRQLGVGDIRYRATLQPMQDWRSHYYTFLSPQLEYLIVEERYRLAPAEAQQLAEWLQAQSARLAPRPRGPQDQDTAPGDGS